MAGIWFVLDGGPSRIALGARKSPAQLLAGEYDICFQESKMTKAEHLQGAHGLVERLIHQQLGIKQAYEFLLWPSGLGICCSNSVRCRGGSPAQYSAFKDWAFNHRSKLRFRFNPWPRNVHVL